MDWPTEDRVLSLRGARNPVSGHRPYAFLAETEYGAAGVQERVNTIFLTNRECPLRCLYCDLWKNTLPETVAAGAIPAQIDRALSQLPEADVIKLYNSGNFFDPRAIPRSDYPEIARRVARYSTVIVENHPAFHGRQVAEFQQRCGTQLEVAVGLEIADDQWLQRLHKRMTCRRFQTVCRELLAEQIRIRAFVLLKPPGATEEQGVELAKRTVEFAWDHGVDCCAVIPVRGGNGVMEYLRQHNQFAPPALRSLEAVIEQLADNPRGRLFADLWDLEQFSECPACLDRRRNRLQQWNLTQAIIPADRCPGCTNAISSESC